MVLKGAVSFCLGREADFPVIWKPFNFLPAFFAKMLEEKLDFGAGLFENILINDTPWGASLY